MLFHSGWHLHIGFVLLSVDFLDGIRSCFLGSVRLGLRFAASCWRCSFGCQFVVSERYKICSAIYLFQVYCIACVYCRDETVCVCVCVWQWPVVAVAVPVPSEINVCNERQPKINVL